MLTRAACLRAHHGGAFRPALLLTVTAVLLAADPADAVRERPGAGCPEGSYAYETGGQPRDEGATNDPLARFQWNLEAVNAPGAWERGRRGRGAVVAVIDTGVDLHHPDLRGNLVPGRSFLPGEDPRCPQDDVWHGTHVAGIVSASANNGVGVAGVAPEAKVMPLRVGNGQVLDSRAAVAAVRWATTHGADVINMSFVTDPVLQPVLGPPQGADVQGYIREMTVALDEADRAGVVLVAGAGNGSTSQSLPAQCGFPASHPAVICVGGVGRNGVPYRHSNFASKAGQPGAGVVAPSGAALDQEENLVKASGMCGELNHEIYSTQWPGAQGFCGRAYEIRSGTSMAAPHVSAIAAMLAGCGLDGRQVRERILTTAGDGGWDVRSGYGLVNAEAATAACPQGR